MLDNSLVRAAALMARTVITVHQDDNLQTAVRLLARHGISGLPVVDHDGALVGMLTEGDLLRWHEGLSERQAAWLDRLGEGYAVSATYIETLRDVNHRVKAVMSPRTVTVPETTPARDVAQLMLEQGIKRVPVMRDGKMTGILSRSDLVRALADALDAKPDAAPQEHRTIDEVLRHAREETLAGVPKLP